MVYKDKDLERLAPIIAEAKALWKKRCKEDFDSRGDVGSCVLGAGITVDYLPPRCRSPRRHMIISADDVSCAQGSLNWESSHGEIINYLRKHGVDAHYEWGRMD